jgi:multidrug efflux pump subunit AcrA (membrane-fusion protein)
MSAHRLALQIIAASAALLLGAGALPAQDMPPAKVSTVPVVTHEFSEVIEIVGEAEAWRKGRASAEVDGLVLSVDVVEGRSVDTSKVLVAMKTSLTKIRKRRAEADLLLAKEQLAEYRRGARPEDVREARARLTEAQATKNQADEDLGRMQELQKTNSAAAEDLTAAVAKAGVAAAVLAQRQATLDRILAGPREEVIARAAAKVAVQQAVLDEIKDEIERASIKAPFPGVVTKKLVEAGHFVRRGDPVFELIQLDQIRIVVPVPEKVIAQVKPGLAIDMRFDALRDRTFKGRVEAIVPAADPQARTFPVKVVIENKDHLLLPGMVARIVVPLSAKQKCSAVPRDAVVNGPQGPVVYVVRGGLAAAVPVVPGLADGLLLQVTGDLKAGEAVVVRGNERLMPGQPVQVVSASGQDSGENGQRP